MKTMKDIVKELCSERDITVQQLEKILGFSNGTIGKWNTSEPNSARVEKVAEYFQVSVEYLRGKTNIKNSYDIYPLNKITAEELHMIDLYRLASPAEQEMIMSFLRKYE